MRILVTGGAGFIGSHTCVELLTAGHQLVVVDNFCNSKRDVLDKIRQIAGQDFTFYEADLRDRDAMENIFASQPLDAVIHFAGLKAVGESVQKPLAYYSNNLIGTLVLLETMRRHDVKRIVFSSSATVYGMNNPVPFREDYPTSATNPYGYTKVVIEQMMRDLAHSDAGWSIALLRYFNPIGAHESGLLGESPTGVPNNLFPYIMQVAAGRLDHVNIYGDDYDTVDGTGVRDYIHVVDLANGHLAALEYLMNHTGAEAINLGTGKGTSVFELIHAFERVCDCTIPYQVAGRRPGDVAEGYADVTKAKKLLGWTATHTLEDMCRDGWHYAKGQFVTK